MFDVKIFIGLYLIITLPQFLDCRMSTMTVAYSLLHICYLALLKRKKKCVFGYLNCKINPINNEVRIVIEHIVSHNCSYDCYREFFISDGGIIFLGRSSCICQTVLLFLLLAALQHSCFKLKTPNTPSGQSVQWHLLTQCCDSASLKLIPSTARDSSQKCCLVSHTLLLPAAAAAVVGGGVS